MVDWERAELGVHWKDEIKRLVELLLTTEDLRAVQRLTVEVQRAIYLRIEETPEAIGGNPGRRSERRFCC